MYSVRFIFKQRSIIFKQYLKTIIFNVNYLIFFYNFNAREFCEMGARTTLGRDSESATSNEVRFAVTQLICNF